MLHDVERVFAGEPLTSRYAHEKRAVRVDRLSESREIAPLIHAHQHGSRGAKSGS